MIVSWQYEVHLTDLGPSVAALNERQAPYSNVSQVSKASTCVRDMEFWCCNSPSIQIPAISSACIRWVRASVVARVNWSQWPRCITRLPSRDLTLSAFLLRILGCLIVSAKSQLIPSAQSSSRSQTTRCSCPSPDVLWSAVCPLLAAVAFQTLAAVMSRPWMLFSFSVSNMLCRRRWRRETCCSGII